MKLIKPTLAILILLVSFRTTAQDYNPFKSIGKKGKIVTLSKGKYVEVFDYDTIQRIGTVLYNIRTKKIVKLLDADEIFEKFSDNSSASRWYSPDPLAAKFSQWSPYVFAADNPIKYNDPNGKEFVDPNKKHISVHFNKDGTLKFSKNANADFVKLATGMAKTEVGLKLLHTMNDSKTKISMVIDKDNIVKEVNGDIRGGVTDPVIGQNRINGKPVGGKFIYSAKITIYEKGIKSIADEHNGKMNIGGKDFDTKTTPIDDIMASFGVHEGTHATDRKSSSDLNPNASSDEIEKKPYANQLLYLKQLEDKKD